MKLRSNAFSLIEVVISLGIFTFCIIGIVGLLPIASNAVKSVSLESSANNVA
jgi:type II secretory pathway pseudopilin PulG